MATIDFPDLFIITLLCLTLVLTSSSSSVSNYAIAPDGKLSKWQTFNQHVLNINKLLTLHLDERYSNIIDNKNISKENVTNTTTVMAEGGPILISTSTRRTTNHLMKDTSIIIDNFEQARERETVPSDRNATFSSSSVVARKGVEEKKIKPRKGVNQSSVDLNKEKLSYSNTKPAVVQDSSTTENTLINNQFKTFNINDDSSLGNLTFNGNSNRNTTSDANLTLASRNISHIIQAKKHKPKPTVTSVDETKVVDDDEPIRSSLRIKSSPLGISRKIDYIVPVVTIIALPLLGAATFVLYRRGKDCWDKRHYRRMDFLIDGMYND